MYIKVRNKKEKMKRRGERQKEKPADKKTHSGRTVKTFISLMIKSYLMLIVFALSTGGATTEVARVAKKERIKERKGSKMHRIVHYSTFKYIG